MNKREYLYELEKALKSAQVQDSADILEEYTVHFDMKMQDGYSEKEIAAKLASPKDIAGQFGEIKSVGSAGKAGRVYIKTGLIFMDIIVASFFIILYAWVVVLGALVIAFAGLGIVGVGGISWNIIPEMPYFCSLLLGLALLALAVLSAAGTEYCRLYVTQILRAFSRWHGAVWGKSAALPPLAMHPVIGPKKRRIMRSITLISIAVFAVCFIAAYISMTLTAGSLEFWHVWSWFV